MPDRSHFRRAQSALDALDSDIRNEKQLKLDDDRFEALANAISDMAKNKAVGCPDPRTWGTPPSVDGAADYPLQLLQMGQDATPELAFLLVSKCWGRPDAWDAFREHFKGFAQRLLGVVVLRTDGETVAIVEGGFAYRGIAYALTGKPMAMLRALLDSRHQRCTANQLRKAIGTDDDVVTYPEQVVKDTAKKLRAALRKAAKSAGLSCKNPLPSTGKGADLTYRLEIP